ncbi:tyrosine-type recombinase/integrase, partial [Candidatus Woesearchaeota archaeon]|nr:tyrosine-type recombinase/integrase [Candidatus Woesearchaeota archaeon]
MGPKTPKNSSRDAAVRTRTDFSRDLSLLLQYANTRERLLLRLLAETGITLKELVNLKKTSLRGRELAVAQRTISLSTPLATKLAAYTRTQPHDYLFSSRQTAQLTTRRVEQLIAAAAKEASVKITARDLRNAYLLAATQQARDTEELKELTGLKSITKERVLTKHELTRLNKVLKKTTKRDKALVKTILETGLSLQETLALTRKDLTTLALTT